MDGKAAALLHRMERKTQILSDESLNRNGYWLPTSGAQLEAYKANPVIMVRHAGWILSIGKMNNIRIEDGKILGDPEFDQDDYLALEVERKWRHGYLNAGSVGFKYIELSNDPADMKPGQTKQTPVKWEMLEYSFLNVPGNSGALALSNGAPTPLPEIQTVKMKKEHLALLGLSEGATDEQITAAINGQKKNQVEAVLKLGVEKGVVNDGNKAHYEKLGMHDLAALQGIVDAATAEAKPEQEKADPKSMEAALRLNADAKNKVNVNGEDRSTWGFLEYNQKDPKALAKIKNEEPEKYQALVLAYTGK